MASAKSTRSTSGSSSQDPDGDSSTSNLISKKCFMFKLKLGFINLAEAKFYSRCVTPYHKSCAARAGGRPDASYTQCCKDDSSPLIRVPSSPSFTSEVDEVLKSLDDNNRGPWKVLYTMLNTIALKLDIKLDDFKSRIDTLNARMDANDMNVYCNSMRRLSQYLTIKIRLRNRL